MGGLDTARSQLSIRLSGTSGQGLGRLGNSLLAHSFGMFSSTLNFFLGGGMLSSGAVLMRASGGFWAASSPVCFRLCLRGAGVLLVVIDGARVSGAGVKSKGSMTKSANGFSFDFEDLEPGQLSFSDIRN